MKKNILISIGCLILIFVFSYFSYLIGLGASQTTSVVFYMVPLKEQTECIKSNDIKCIKLTNSIMHKALEVQAKSLLSTQLSGDFEDQIKTYLEWSNNNVSLREK